MGWRKDGRIMGRMGARAGGQQTIMSAHDHRRPLWHVALVVVLIVGVGLHAIGVIVVSKVGLGIVSVNSPILYILIGVVLAGVLFKLTHIVGIRHKRQKGSRDTL